MKTFDLLYHKGVRKIMLLVWSLLLLSPPVQPFAVFTKFHLFTNFASTTTMSARDQCGAAEGEGSASQWQRLHSFKFRVVESPFGHTNLLIVNLLAIMGRINSVSKIIKIFKIGSCVDLSHLRERRLGSSLYLALLWLYCCWGN